MSIFYKLHPQYQHRLLGLLLFLAVLLLTAVPVRAANTPDPVKETGTLTGIVVDSESGEPISFAYLFIKELGRMKTAHSNGQFTFKNRSEERRVGKEGR